MRRAGGVEYIAESESVVVEVFESAYGRHGRVAAGIGAVGEG